MANSTIPGLVAVSVPALTDLIGVRQSGDTRDKKLTVTQLLSLAPGGGDVTKVGTPVDDQVGVWTGDGTIEGTSGLKFGVPGLQIDGAGHGILMASGAGHIQFAASSTPELRNEGASGTNPTVIPNKADLDTGLGLAVADGLSLIAGGVEIARATEAALANQFAVVASGAVTVPDLTGLADPDTGFRWAGTNVLNFIGGASIAWSFSPTQFFSAFSDGPAMANTTGDITVAGFLPQQADTDTGLGGDGNDTVSLVAGGIVGIRLKGLNSGVIQAPDASVGITAFATGGQANATQLNRSNNVLATVATTADSVKLPPVFFINSVVFVKNDGVNAADVFPAVGDDLGAGLNTAVSLAAGESVSFIATVANATWTPWIVDIAGAGDVIKVGTPVDDQVGVWTGDGTIEGTSALTLGASALNVSTRVRTANAAPSAPAYSFGSETNTGIYRQGAGSLGISLAGAGNWLFQAASFFGNISAGPQLMFEGATATNPTLVPRLSDTDSGIGSAAADQVSIIAGGAEIVRAVEQGANNNQFIITQTFNNATFPSLAWGDGDTGFFENPDDTLNISLGGVGKWFLAGDLIGSINGSGAGIRNETASASNPTVNARRSDDNTGLGSAAADQLDLIAGGLSCLSVRETAAARQIGFYVTAPISLQTGVAVSSAGIHAALVALGLITA
jgi:hypothetical protein